ncbi:MAG TPA: hypothetical protein VJ204_12270 [Solirubrobacterales bacterium]|nr:hypothetical protein [Solirubrobacterales bacterium]
MRSVRGMGWRIGVVALALGLLGSGASAAGAGRPGTPDPSFGKGGRVTISLPNARTASRFGPVAATADGGFLVGRQSEADREANPGAIERREADGTLDRSFGTDGSAPILHPATALAEDSTGGVIYGSAWGIGRLEPDGKPDKRFDKNARGLPELVPETIAINASGQIVIGAYSEGGARNPVLPHPYVMRLEPDGTLDPGFGEHGLLSIEGSPFSEEVRSGKLGLLPDGSMLVLADKVLHVSAAGAVEPGLEVAAADADSLAVYPDGSFAFATSTKANPGCAIYRYGADGAPDQAFAKAGVFSDPSLQQCAVTAGPEGGLLITGQVETSKGATVPRLLRLTAAGVPDPSFGEGGTATVSLPKVAIGDKPLYLGRAIFLADGGIVAPGSGSEGFLLGREADGAPRRGFGTAGTIVEAGSVPSRTLPGAATAEPDGDVIVTGLTDSGAATLRPFWMRFAPDGKLIRTPSGAAFAVVRKVGPELRPVGSDGLYSLIGGNRPYVAEYEPDGAPFVRFGVDGRAQLPQGFDASSFAVDPDGGVTVFGVDRSGRRMAAYRLTAAGRPAPGFGRHGLATVGFPGSGEAKARSGALLPGGGVVLTGFAHERLAVAELGPDGRPRRAFGQGGRLVCACGGRSRPSDVDALFHHGHVYVLDHWSTAEGEESDLVKLTPAGRLDRTFAGRGYRAFPVGISIGLFAHRERLAIVSQRDYFAGPAQVRAVRLDGSLVRGYRGTAAVDTKGEGKERLAAAQQPDGRLVLVGDLHANDGSGGTRLRLLGLR